MAELVFTEEEKADGRKVWVSEVTVNGRYALHLERATGGTLGLWQRSTAEGGYAPCVIPQVLSQSWGAVVDWVFDHGVYPMHIRVESGSSVTSGTVTEGA